MRARDLWEMDGRLQMWLLEITLHFRTSFLASRWHFFVRRPWLTHFLCTLANFCVPYCLTSPGTCVSKIMCRGMWEMTCNVKILHWMSKNNAPYYKYVPIIWKVCHYDMSYKITFVFKGLGKWKMLWRKNFTDCSIN